MTRLFYLNGYDETDAFVAREKEEKYANVRRRGLSDLSLSQKMRNIQGINRTDDYSLNNLNVISEQSQQQINIQCEVKK